MPTRLVDIEKFLADRQQTEMRAKLTDQAKEAGWKHFYEGIPCPSELKVFAEEVVKIMPNVKFLPMEQEYISYAVTDDNGVYQTSKNLRIFNEFALYLEEYPLDIGRINFKDNGARKKNVSTYGIYSRKITNAKYAYHRDQHHMVTATDVKKAVKNVSKYVSPFSTKELAQAYYDNIRINVGQTASKVGTELSSVASTISNDRLDMMKEILNLKKQGVQFSSARFREAAENVEDLMSRYEAEQNRDPSAIFVRFYQVGEDTYFSTQQAIEVKKHHSTLCGTEEMKIEGKPVSEIPEDVMGAVSVLSILNDGQYVANVGTKINSRHFWIERG